MTDGDYVVAIHVPLYVDGPRVMAVSEWARALRLLRDSFDGRFARFVVVAPSLPASATTAVLEPLGPEDGFDLRPSIPHDRGKRAYWLGGDRKRWKADVTRALEGAAVAHTGLGDLYRPVNRDALELALARPLTSVFVRDTDEVAKIRDLIATGLMRPGPDRALYLKLYVRALESAVKRADLSLLKGQVLFDRYGPLARNPQLFQDTSYSSDEIVPADRIEKRLSTRSQGDPLRLVYAGRLVARKGCDHAVRIIAAAREAGANVTLDLIGDGPMRPALEAEVASLSVGDSVRFLGAQPYAGLIDKMSDYDGLLFTPVAEDTPRMIFDGYAAGLPLLAYDIPYVKERATTENATLALPLRNVAEAAERLRNLAQDPGQLRDLTWAAHKAATENATDIWYKRRAEWTLEAHERRLASTR